MWLFFKKKLFKSFQFEPEMVHGIMFLSTVVYLKNEAARSSETFLTYHNTTWRHKTEGLDVNFLRFFTRHCIVSHLVP